jgi:replication-associated recombination protein RarA
MTYYQQKLGQYDYFEVISALRKTIKVGREEDALYWLNVLVTLGDSGAKTGAKQLWIMAAENIDDELVVLRAFAVRTFRNIAGHPPT